MKSPNRSKAIALSSALCLAATACDGAAASGGAGGAPSSTPAGGQHAGTGGAASGVGGGGHGLGGAGGAAHGGAGGATGGGGTDGATGGGGHGGAGTTGGQGQGGAPAGCAQPVAFADVQATVLGGCSGFGPMSCHTKSPFGGGLDLTQGHAWGALVGVPSHADPAIVRVKPGDLASSLLWRKLTNDLPADGSLGQPMPKGEAMAWKELPQNKMDAVRCWILEGAPND
jgi:hypothetical protein